MKYKIYKIIVLTIFIAFFLTGLGKICFAQQRLNINYPTIQGITITGNTEIPQLIKYIYLFSLGIVGFIALLSMLIGAIKYIFSAGNPSKASDAKDQIFSAVLGILILLASVLILRTINPDLVNIGIRLEPINPVNVGPTSTVSYRCFVCCILGAGTCAPNIAITYEQPWGSGQPSSARTCRNIPLSSANSLCDNSGTTYCSGYGAGYGHHYRIEQCP